MKWPIISKPVQEEDNMVQSAHKWGRHQIRQSALKAERKQPKKKKQGTPGRQKESEEEATTYQEESIECAYLDLDEDGEGAAASSARRGQERIQSFQCGHFLRPSKFVLGPQHEP